MSSSPAPAVPKRAKKSTVSQVVALFDYKAQTNEELSFEEGDVIFILQKVDDDWYLGKLGEDKGLVPVSYVSADRKLEDPLHDAARRGNLSSLQEFVRIGLDPTATDAHDHTPLHWAARSGHLACVKFLVQTNSSVLNALNHQGETPLHMAAWGGKLEVVKYLLSLPGINITAKNKEGKTARDLARGTDVAAELLLATAPIAADNGHDSDDE